MSIVIAVLVMCTAGSAFGQSSVTDLKTVGAFRMASKEMQLGFVLHHARRFRPMASPGFALYAAGVSACLREFSSATPEEQDLETLATLCATRELGAPQMKMP